MMYKGLYYIVEYILQKDIIIVADCLHLLLGIVNHIYDGKLNSLKVRQ